MNRGWFALGVLVAGVGGVHAQELLSVNQSATVDAPSEPAVSPSEPSPKELTPPRTRKASRKLGVETATLSADASTPWYRTGLGATTVVLALLGVFYLAVRRWVPSAKTASNAAMNVVARSAVTPKHGLATVQWGRRFVLVGMSPDRMDTLAEINDANEAAELAGILGVRWPAGASSFDETLLTESSAFDERDEPNPELALKSNAVKELLERLKTLRSA